MAATRKDIMMFIYEGKDKRGITKRGELTRLSEAAVKAVLRKQGILPTKVKKKPKPLCGEPIKPEDIVLFTRQLAKMMNSGIHLIDSLGVLGQGHEKPAFRRLVMAIKSRVEAGETLASVS